MFLVGDLVRPLKLDALARRAFFRQLGMSPPPADDAEFPDDRLLAFWTLVLLTKLALSVEQRTLIFEEMQPELADLQRATTDFSLPQPMLVIADGRYATWTGKVGFVDLQSGGSVLSPASPPLESAAYDLRVLYARNAAGCRKLKESQDASDRRRQPAS